MDLKPDTKSRNLAVMAAAKAEVAANLPEACQEIAEWRDTCILRDGVVRRVARILDELDTNTSLVIAERLVECAAIDRVAGINS